MDRREFRLEIDAGHHVVGDHEPAPENAPAAPGYLFLHGLGSDRAGQKSDSLWAHARARGRAFTRFDLRGHGGSSGTIGVVTVSELIADTIAVLERFGPAIVVGSSLGGMVSAFVTARRPELVRGLGLIAPALGFVQRLERSVGHDGMMRTGDGRGFPLAQRVLDDARTLDERALPHRITVPVLIAHGTNDDIVPVSRSRRFFAAIENERKALWIVDGGDHALTDHTNEIWTRLDQLLEARP